MSEEFEKARDEAAKSAMSHHPDFENGANWAYQWLSKIETTQQQPQTINVNIEELRSALRRCLTVGADPYMHAELVELEIADLKGEIE